MAQARLALVDDHESGPRRIDHAALERAVSDMLRAPPAFRATTFPNDDGYEGLIVAQAIPFHSLCMHHLLPFRGLAHVGVQIADRLKAELRPAGVGVGVEAEHMCMSLRGVQQPGTRTVTSALRGAIRDDAETRQEFLALTGRTPHDR